jgi:hypothetical protein
MHTTFVRSNQFKERENELYQNEISSFYLIESE